ncbi:MAG TPA: TlpA disulfide reductase family protein [Burkholderiales bacterium]|nr:TlpA disulfide reductase family protein [Burkholderiales bacterium]
MKQIAWAFLLFLAFSSFSHASDWTLRDTAGHSLTLSRYSGKWVLVNFWATWCPPCLEEIPVLQKLAKQGTLAVIGIAMSYRDSSEVLDFSKKNHIYYPVVLGDDDIADKFGGIDTLPTSFLYSPEGKLVGQHMGPLTEKDVEGAMHGASFSN